MTSQNYRYTGISATNTNDPSKKHYTHKENAITSVQVTPTTTDPAHLPSAIHVEILVDSDAQSENWVVYKTLDLSSRSQTIPLSAPNSVMGIRLSGITGSNVFTLIVTEDYGGFSWVSDPSTLRILELDGGGMRGCYSMQGLDKICTTHGLPPGSLTSVFDVMCGTSIGGLATLGLCFGKTPLELFNIMKAKGKDIFNASWTWGTGKAYWPDKVAFATGATESMYGNTELQTVVESIVGTGLVSDIRETKVILPTVRYFQNVPDGQLFPKKAEALMISNYNADGFSNGWTAKDAAMATSAAPMYLPKWPVGNDFYIDGGLAQNNLAPLGVYLGRILKPEATRVFVLSLGTGLGNLGFARDTPPSSSQLKFNLSNVGLLADCIGMGVSFPQESNNFLIDLMSQVSRLSFYKYRFNTDFDPTKDCELDSTSPDAIDYFSAAATETYQRDSDEISTFIQKMKIVP